MNNDFVIYVIEEYKKAHNLNGKEVISIFNKFNLINFVRNGYGALHTVGSNEIVWNIDEYIRNRTTREEFKALFKGDYNDDKR